MVKKRKFKRKIYATALDKKLIAKSLKALKRNVKRRKGKYATARDQELMFGY